MTIVEDNRLLRQQALTGLRALIRLAGDDPDREGLADTPSRVIRAVTEHCIGYDDTAPVALLTRKFEASARADQTVTVGPVEFASLCEHHLLPFTGTAHVAYIPAGQGVVGLSKFARLVDHYAARLQVQERLTEQLADAVAKHVPADDVAVLVKASHACMTSRGVRKPRSAVTTCDLRGAFRENASARAEFLAFAAP